jgi:hypothetical protein
VKKLISSSEIIETVRDGDTEWEICAVAEANYDESDSRVVVDLESFLRKITASGDGELRHLPWLPGNNRVTEHVPREEASQVAHDVFASWVRKVRQSIPPDPLKTLDG